LANAMKAAKSAGLTIIQTQIDPGGKITLIHIPTTLPQSAATPDELLDGWKAKRNVG
jgi:hypothetical protein